MLIGKATKFQNYRIKRDSAMYREHYRYFLVTALIRSSSISIIAEDEQNRLVDLDRKAMQLVDVSSNVSVKKSGKGKLTFKGNQSLVSGV